MIYGFVSNENIIGRWGGQGRNWGLGAGGACISYMSQNRGATHFTLGHLIIPFIKIPAPLLKQLSCAPKVGGGDAKITAKLSDNAVGWLTCECVGWPPVPHSFPQPRLESLLGRVEVVVNNLKTALRAFVVNNRVKKRRKRRFDYSRDCCKYVDMKQSGIICEHYFD